MHWFDKVDWSTLFLPQTPILEILVRGTIVYLALFGLLRVVLKRQRSGVGVTDVLVIVLIADAAQNAMAGSYKSITDGVLLVGVIIGWSALLDWAAFRVPALRRVLRPAPLAVYEGGRLKRANMAKEFITEGELMSELRMRGITDLSQVEKVIVEGDGEVSVIRTHPADLCTGSADSPEDGRREARDSL